LLLRNELEPLLVELGAAERDRVYVALHESVGRGVRVDPRLTRDDLAGAAAIFAVQIFCCVPALVPFLVLDHPGLALRVSNGLLILVLFAVGLRWAREIDAHRAWTAIAIALVGVGLVGMSVALGG
jgi:VIT1/CCC1 family predicted Fe2+/Mn2+ transporter